MRDVVLLFGAGASYGAGGALPEQPPLGTHLYAILEKLYPNSWGSLSREIKVGFRSGNFEAGMEGVYLEHSFAIPQLMREMAIYFIQFRPYQSSTLYGRLIKDLATMGLLERVLFSTLNYECLIEFSLIDAGYSISYFDLGEPPLVPVWKLHGSCNFFARNLQARPGVGYGLGVTWEGGVQASLDSNQVIEHCLVQTALAPIMSLYMKGKPLNVSPSSIERLQQRWSALVEEASATFTVGLRPWPDDQHIWRPLALAPGHLFFVGDRDEFENWRRAYRSSPSEYLGGRFNLAYPRLIERIRDL